MVHVEDLAAASRTPVRKAEEQELLAADPVGVAADHGLEQFAAARAHVVQLVVGFMSRGSRR